MTPQIATSTEAAARAFTGLSFDGMALLFALVRYTAEHGKDHVPCIRDATEAMDIDDATVRSGLDELRACGLIRPTPTGALTLHGLFGSIGHGIHRVGWGRWR